MPVNWILRAGKPYDGGMRLTNGSRSLAIASGMHFVFSLAKNILAGDGRIFRLLVVLLWAVAAPAPAQDDAPVFVSPSRPQTAGTEGALWLYCLNSSPNDLNLRLPSELTGTVTAGADAHSVQLWLNTNRSPVTVVVAPGGFARIEYRWVVPASLSGTATLAISNYNAVVVQVTLPDAGPPLAGSTPGVAAAPPVSSQAAYLGFLTNHLSTYEPIYFILGTDPAAKFQFSIKYRVFNLTNEDNPIGHLYFAYTQTSFWDLLTKDPSFYDTSYKPSAFLLYNDVYHRDFFHLDLQSGFEHESNGKGGTDERSLNTVYLQPTGTFDLTDSLAWRLQPRVWDYLSLGQYDQDMATYRGYVDLLTDLTWADPHSAERIQLAVKARMGDDWEHEGWWLTARFNLAGVPWLRSFNPTIQVEYFTGYGQTLRQYNESSHGLRAGLCLYY